MKKLVLALLILLTAGCAAGKGDQSPPTTASPASSAAAQDPNRITATVTRIIDGDTVEVTIDGKKETVRMILVDTPETKKPNTEVQPFGPEATEFTKQMLENKTVQLEKDVSGTDKYGRFLYYIWLDGKLYNEMLLEKGLARVAVYPPDVKYVDEFRQVQKQAQQAAIGIWSIENYATDKGYDTSKAKSSARPAQSPFTTVKPVQTPAAATPNKATAPQAPSAPVTSKNEVYYKNCTEANAAGAYNLKRGEPGYRAEMDGDNDGVACERKP